MKSVLLNFRRIDDIPEDQNKRDEIRAKTDPPSVKQQSPVSRSPASSGAGRLFCIFNLSYLSLRFGS